MGLDPPDQNLEAWRSHENVPPVSVPSQVKQGSRRWRQVQLPEHSKESEGETHLQGMTEGPQAGGDGAEAMEQYR